MKTIVAEMLFDGLRLRYSTAPGKATLLASDTGALLFGTPRDRYFIVKGEGGLDTLEPISNSEARELFERLPGKRVTYEEAFPWDSMLEEA